MISIRSPIAAIALVVLASVASLATAHHDHHHHHHGEGGFSWSMTDDGKQTQSEAFADCFCWNTTSDNWCHNKLDGSHTGFWRDSCARVVAYNTWWWIPVILWCMYLILMPILFCMFRLCCNCCGGRTPSFGCCCPISNRILSPDPKFVRPYSKCATWTAKILAVIVFITVLDVSIHAFIQNSDVHNDVNNAADQIQSVSNALIYDATMLSSTFQQLASEPWMNTATMSTLNQISNVLPTLKTIHHDAGEVHRADRHHRLAPTNAIVAMPLLLVVIVTLLAFCNVRSWPISFAAGLLSFITFLVVLLASTTFTVSTGMNLVCDNSAPLTKFAKALATTNGFCNIKDVTTAINGTQVAYAKYMCSGLGLEQMIAQAVPSSSSSSSASYNLSFCDERLGGMYTMGTKPHPWSVFQFGLPITTQLVNGNRIAMMMIDNTLAATSNGQSLYGCSQNASCSDFKTTQSIVKSVKAIYGEARGYGATATASHASLTYVMEMNHDCTIVDSIMTRQVKPLMCGDEWAMEEGVPTGNLAGHMQHLAGLLLGLAVTCTLAFFVWINGSKRFTKAASKDELLGHHAVHQQHAALNYGLYQQGLVEQQQEEPKVVQGIYDNGVNGPKPSTTTAAVAATTQEPLLLRHQAPTYSDNSVNNRSAADVDIELPVKQQPESV